MERLESQNSPKSTSLCLGLELLAGRKAKPGYFRVKGQHEKENKEIAKHVVLMVPDLW